MELLSLPYRNSSIGYYRFGSGPRPAFCFHGYGEEAAVFEFLGKYAGNEFTFFSIDLPFHGRTEWKDGLTFTPTDLADIIKEILKQPDSKPRTPNSELQTPNSKLSLIGFSLGGRAALSLCQAMPENVERLVLLATDGLKLSFWYRFSTQTWLGNKFFHFTLKNPGWFFAILKGLNKLKLVNASVFKFVKYYIGDAEQRQLLYARWTTLRKLKPGLKDIKILVKKNNIQIRLVYGMHDRIIRSSVGEKFKKGIEEYCTVSVIHAGHQVLHEKHIDEILPALLH